MTIDSLIMFSGAFIAALPFLGFPYSWDNVFLVIVGIFIVALGIVVRRRGVYPPRKHEVPAPIEPESPTYTEGVE